VINRVFLAGLAWISLCQAANLGLLYAPVADGGQARLIRAANAAGDVFVVSTSTNASGRVIVTAAKLDVAGQVLATINVGDSGQGYDEPSAAAVDSAGDLIIAGSSYPKNSAFVVKLDPQLARTIFTVYLGGASGYTAGGGVALDPAGNIYVSGITMSADFPVTAGAFQTKPPVPGAFGGPSYAFVAKLPPDGSRILASTYFGADAINCTGGSGCIGVYGSTLASSIAVDSSGRVWIAGSTSARDLPTTPGAYSSNCACGKWQSAGFIAAFDSNLSTLLASTFVPFTDSASGYARIAVRGIAIGVGGGPVIVGTADSGFPTTAGTVQPSVPASGGSINGFITGLDPSLHSLLFGTYFGTKDVDGGVGAIEMTQDGSFWITGLAGPATLPVTDSSARAFGPTYMARLTADASRIITLSTAPGGAAGQALAMSPAGTPVALGTSGSVLNAPTLLGVANAAASVVSGRVSPLEVVSLYGVGIGPAEASGPVFVDGIPSTTLRGYQVLFDGVAAQLLYAGPDQFNVIVPDNVYSHDTVRVSIEGAGQSFEGPLMWVVEAVPAVFAGVVNQDGSVNSESNPASPGSIVSIWLTGRAAADLSVLHAGDYQQSLSLEVVYAGDAPGLVRGIGQVNFRLPVSFGLTAGTARNFLVQSGGASSAPFTVYVTD
jgi:uncharacterized protein (TIGR03437 family)